jgi:hypothetical protein
LLTPCRFGGARLPTLEQMAHLAAAAIPGAGPEYHTLVHGDFCFSNIFYDFRSQRIRVIDPRGLDASDAISPYGDRRYDIGKLHHSAIGMYDMIMVGNCALERHGRLDLALTLPKNASTRAVRNATPAFVRDECWNLGIADAHISVLRANTRGQAETVELGLLAAAVPGNEPVTIFNIDTFRPSFSVPALGEPTDGYLEVFRGEGANWSYVRPAAVGSNIAAETAEKQPISDLCCTGLYHFGSADLFRSTYDGFASHVVPSSALRELYVAAMYDALIRNGYTIRYSLFPAEAAIFCGVPAEYEAFLQCRV